MRASFGLAFCALAHALPVPAVSTGLGQEFPCTLDLQPSASIPTSVHKLRPADIQVVGAIGDSVTAGFGETSTGIFNLFQEQRGRSWSIGYELPITSLVTMPSILKGFNSDLKGGSTGSNPVLEGPKSADAHFNVAVSAAVSVDMSGQAKDLISKVKADSSVDFENDWKVVTIWIGGNDLCSVCNKKEEFATIEYGKHLEEALDVLFEGMPRVFVNMVSILEITQLSSVVAPRCDKFPGTIRNMVCPCGTSDDPKERAFVMDMSVQYQQITEKVANSPKYSGREDFAVVVQPFFTETVIPQKDGSPDDAYFAADCFHLSSMAHQAAGVALWNNMLQPVGAKSTAWTVGEEIKCPATDAPYLYTAKNSIKAAISR